MTSRRESRTRAPFITIGALAASLVVAAGAMVRAEDWNQWRGPWRSGQTASFTPPARWPDKPARVWQAALGAGHASPVVAGGRVYQFSRIGDQEAVTALDVASGRQLWQQRYDAPYQMISAARFHGLGPKSTPVIAGTRLFTFGISGILSAFDTASGKVLWRKHYATQFDAAWPDFGVAISPAVDGGLLVVHVGGNKSGALVALDVASGAEKWSWKGDGPGYASPIAATIGKTRQIVTQSRSYVIGVGAADGALLWRIPLTTEYSQNIVTPVVVGDVVVFSGIEKPLTAVRIVQASGQWTVQPVWQNPEVPLYMSSPVVSGSCIVGLTHRNKGQFFCADAKTGKTLWTTRGREGENAALVAAGDLILATTTEGELVIARPRPATLEVVKRYTVADSPVWAHPAPAGRGVLIKDAETLAYWVF